MLFEMTVVNYVNGQWQKKISDINCEETIWRWAINIQKDKFLSNSKFPLSRRLEPDVKVINICRLGIFKWRFRSKFYLSQDKKITIDDEVSFKQTKDISLIHFLRPW